MSSSLAATASVPSCSLALALALLASLTPTWASPGPVAATHAGQPAGTAPDAPVFEQPPADIPNLTGKWAIPRPITHLLTADGKEPPLNDAGKAEYARRQAALQAGDRKIDPISACLMHGTPRLLYAPHPFLILQTTRSVNFVHEVNHTFRIIYWDKQLPDDPDANYLGYSSARFEGPTLVIDTIGMNDKTWLDYSGLPHGAQLQVQERYTLEDSNTIKGSITLTDPGFYTAPWTTNFVLKRQPGMELEENVCMDTHRM
jgi:hypothetical protein